MCRLSVGLPKGRSVGPILGLLLLAVVTASQGRAAPIGSFNEWKGEYFQKKEGGFYAKSTLKMRGASNIQVQTYNILERKAYGFSLKPGAGPGYPSQLWKGPSGKYVIRSITVVDGKGVTRTWNGKPRKTFLIKRLTLANLGLWTIAPKGKAGLKVKFGMVPNTYTEDGSKRESSLVAVINGFTGLVQERFAGKKLYKQSEKDFGSDGQLRATVKFTRQIAMFYKLNLFKHNTYAQPIAKVLSVHDPNLRKCYTDRLDWNDKLRGTVKFNFILSKSTGTMAKLKKTGGSVNDTKMVECMYFELAAISFPVPTTMLGEVEYTFDVR